MPASSKHCAQQQHVYWLQQGTGGHNLHLLHGKDFLTSGKCFFHALNSSKGDVTMNANKQKMEVKFVL